MKWYSAQGDSFNAIIVPFFRFSILLVYAVCVGLAIVRRKEPDWHKRLMFLGTFALLEAPLDRMYGNVFGVSDDVRGPLALGSHLVLMIMFVIWDRCAFGRFHPVTRWGTILIVAFLVLTPPIASTEWWRAVAAGLAN